MSATILQPFSLVIFGASGHLASMKLYPALYVLALKKRLPTKYAIIGFSRTAMTTEAFRDLVSSAIHTAYGEVTATALQDLLAHVHYVSGDYTSATAFAALAQKLHEVDAGSPDWVRMMYLSVPPSVFSPILDLIAQSGVRVAGQSFRCIVEKPVGHDGTSAQLLLKQLYGHFPESEVFLLDHYLGKEAVRNIYYLRYANPILERLLKNTLIKSVEITAWETAGIENRAGYFEQAGTLRDMVQSHLLLMIALLTMRLESEETFRFARLSALEQLYLPPAPNNDALILQGQYAEYGQEPGVAKSSRNNTYCALQLLSRTSRWQGVPFFLRTGKRLQKKETRISILFQEPRPVGPGETPNRLDIILQGEAGMRMFLQTKVGGTTPQFRPLVLTDPLVCTGDCLPEHGLLLLEAILGKQQWYVSPQEIQTAWRLIDPLQVYLNSVEAPLHTYANGSEGPTEVEAWVKKGGGVWLS